MVETNRIEFKQELTDDLDMEKEVVAFLNYREGGIIYVGIDKDGNAVGVKDLDGDMLKIKARIRNNVSPSPMGLFDVTAETINDEKVIKIFVASGSEKPYYKTKYGMSTKGCFIRVGTAAEPMTTALIEDLFAHRVRNSLGRIKSPRQDLTFRQLHIYYESKKLKLNENFAKSLELLTADGSYNYVAYLLADENNNSMKLAKYAGEDRCNLISNNEYGYCSLLKATDSILDKLNVENTVTSTKTYPYRIDKTLWDTNAMRELIINAVVHNDYSNEIPPKVEIFSNRVEITSAGRLPEGMNEEEFFNGVSNPRNKELMRVFRDVEMVESLGSGMPLVLETYSRDCFTFMQNFIRITIPFEKNSLNDTHSGTHEETLVNTGTGTENGTHDGTHDGTHEQMIINLIREDKNVTRDLMAEKCGVSVRTISRILREMKDKVVYVGSGDKGHWEIIFK
jgi:predicted HTH transcriptional regulator